MSSRIAASGLRMDVTGDAILDQYVSIAPPQAKESVHGSDSQQPFTKKAAELATDFFQEVAVDALGKASASAVIGVAFRVIRLPLAWPFLGHASGMFVGRLVFKGSKHYSESLRKSLTELGMRIWGCFQNHAYLRIGTFVTAVVLTHLWPLMGYLLGVALGALTALTIDLEQCSKRQQVKDAAQRGDSLGSILDQWL